MSKYRVVSGKHMNDKDEFVHQGDTLEMSEAEAAKFPNKFVKVIEETPAASEEESGGKPEGDGKTAKPAGK